MNTLSTRTDFIKDIQTMCEDMQLNCEDLSNTSLTNLLIIHEHVQEDHIMFNAQLDILQQ